MISRGCSNATTKDRGFADEAVVAIKPGADEGMVTYLRVKLLESDMKLKVKGGMCERGDGTQTVTLL
jgi:hypothetical protein